MIQDVVVAPEEVRILLRANRLLHSIVGDDAGTASDPQSEPADPIRISMPARLRRYNGESRILLPHQRSRDAKARPNTALIKALARAHDWKRQLLSGRYASLHALASAEGFSQRYVSQTLRLAYLAPDLVNAILDGRQPPELNVEQLMQQVPTDWKAQKRFFEFW